MILLAISTNPRLIRIIGERSGLHSAIQQSNNPTPPKAAAKLIQQSLSISIDLRAIGQSDNRQAQRSALEAYRLL